MWLTCAVVAALSIAPGQTDALKLTNKRATVGVFGPTRSSNKVLPGDIFYVSFDIAGLQTSNKGDVSFSISVESLDSKGKVQFSNGPNDSMAYIPLGGGTLPTFAHVEIGSDVPAGKYTFHVTVMDRSPSAKGAKAEFTEQYEVLKKDFGIIRPQLTYFGVVTPTQPPQPVPAPGYAAVGETLSINGIIINFERDPKGQPDLEIQINVLDDKGKALLSQPYKQVLREADKDRAWIPIEWPLPLNRAGKFTIELQANDLISKKTAKVAYTVQAVEPK